MKGVRRILITVSMLAYLSSFGGCLTYTYREEVKRREFYRTVDELSAKGKIRFSGPYCYPDTHPLLLVKIGFLAGLVFILLLAFRNPLWATPFILLSFSSYPLWYLDTQRQLAAAGTFRAAGLELYLLKTSTPDALAAFLTSLLAFTVLALNAAALVHYIRNRRLP